MEPNYVMPYISKRSRIKQVGSAYVDISNPVVLYTAARTNPIMVDMTSALAIHQKRRITRGTNARYNGADLRARAEYLRGGACPDAASSSCDPSACDSRPWLDCVSLVWIVLSWIVSPFAVTPTTPDARPFRRRIPSEEGGPTSSVWVVSSSPSKEFLSRTPSSLLLFLFDNLLRSDSEDVGDSNRTKVHHSDGKTNINPCSTMCQ